MVWRKRTRRGFFERAEDFFDYTCRLAEMREILRKDLRMVDEDYSVLL